jgi:hypothetical protein
MEDVGWGTSRARERRCCWRLQGLQYCIVEAQVTPSLRLRGIRVGAPRCVGQSGRRAGMWIFEMAVARRVCLWDTSWRRWEGGQSEGRNEIWGCDWADASCSLLRRAEGVVVDRNALVDRD